MHAVLLIFLDGVGLGEDAAHNPWFVASTPFLRAHLGQQLTQSLIEVKETHRVCKGLDATLEHPGLPQSATGQSALLTGVNAAKVMGRHYGPWPGPTLKRLLEQGNTLFHHTANKPLVNPVYGQDRGACLANAYPSGYFEALSQGKQRLNVPSFAARHAGVPQRTMRDWQAGRAISVDLTGSYALTDPVDPKHVGRQLVDIACGYHFTFFDMWLTDMAGHRWEPEACVTLIQALDAFFHGVYEAVQSLDMTVLITSDHGNLEDKRTRSHTRNAVPLIVWGEHSHIFAEAASLVDIAPRVLQIYNQIQ